MAITCSYCGTEIKENETVCSLCGTAVENTSATVEEKPAPAVEETPAPVVEEVKLEPVAATPAAESKFVCSGCGKEYPAGTKFCSECGGRIEEKKPSIVQKEDAPKFVCSGCGKEYSAGTKFCSECGGKVEEVKPVAPVVFACTGCGKEYPAGTKFCSECGSKVTAKGESEKEKSETVSFENSTLYNIYLQDCGNNNIAVIKEIRRVTGCALSDAYTLADSIPVCLKEGCSAEEVEAIKKQFDACGAVVKIVGSEQTESNKPRPQAVVTVYHECPECFENYENNPGKCPACGNQVESRYDLELTNFNWTLEDCKYLLENGIDCNLLWQKIVTWGADDEYFEEKEFDEEENNRIAEYLLSKGADINFSNPGQMNALSHAVEFNWFDRVKFLVERGADVNRKGDPALSYCNKLLNNNELGEEIKSYLITHGAKLPEKELTAAEIADQKFPAFKMQLCKDGTSVLNVAPNFPMCSEPPHANTIAIIADTYKWVYITKEAVYIRPVTGGAEAVDRFMNNLLGGKVKSVDLLWKDIYSIDCSRSLGVSSININNNHILNEFNAASAEQFANDLKNYAREQGAKL